MTFPSASRLLLPLRPPPRASSSSLAPTGSSRRRQRQHPYTRGDAQATSQAGPRVPLAPTRGSTRGQDSLLLISQLYRSWETPRSSHLRETWLLLAKSKHRKDEDGLATHRSAGGLCRGAAFLNSPILALNSMRGGANPDAKKNFHCFYFNDADPGSCSLLFQSSPSCSAGSTARGTGVIREGVPGEGSLLTGLPSWERKGERKQTAQMATDKPGLKNPGQAQSLRRHPQR